MLHKNSPELTKRNLARARKVLFDVVDFLENEGIGYHLEGGTLLGLVRDGDLLPWDHDIDLSISVNDAERFAANKTKLAKKGYRITQRKMHKDIGGLKKDNYRIFKVKRFWPSLLKAIFPIFHKHMVVADIFVKANDDQFTYWQAMEKILRVDKEHYASFETVLYMGRELRIPNMHEKYLTEKYGDWSVPKKDWVCANDEKTIVEDAYK
ncbi:MAG TPA: LicD family protein [Tenuifilaceae bacterium]|nr:LicD family protein [Tenuifilaceae bacterium]